MSVIVTSVFRLVCDRKIQKLYRFIDKFGERTNCISEKQCAVSKKSRKQFENGEQKTQSFLLTVFKLLAGFFGNSTLLLADAVRSFSEFVNESVKLLDLSIANKPED